MALSAGYALFKQQVDRARQAGRLTDTPVAHSLLARGVVDVEAAINAWLAEQEGIEARVRRRGRREEQKRKRSLNHFAAAWLKRIGSDVAAYIALKVVLDGILRSQKYSAVCLRITSRLLDELRYRKLQIAVPELLTWKLANFTTANYDHMQRSLDHTVRTMLSEEETSDLYMTPQQRLQLGALLLDLLINSTDLVEVRTEQAENSKRHQTEKYIEGTEETNDWLLQRTEHVAWRQGQNIPMVVPPVEWAFGRRGGYRFALRGAYPLVRQNFIYKYDEPEKTDLPYIYRTLNALQNTGWNVNDRVLALLEAQYEQEHKAELPPKPADIDTNEEARKAWRKAAARVKNEQHRWTVEMRKRRRVLDTAKLLVDETFYFPYSLDFRGRIYPIADYLHPQGDDMAKALLQFSQGKPLSPEGIGWLAIHGANCMGQEGGVKMSRLVFSERIAWVNKNEDRIRACAREPLINRWWQEADDPYQFFAFCVEWDALLEADAKGEVYVCCLPVHLDGTCNGLQHFSAMLRDQVGAEAVNVVPNERPQDIYQRIADVVLDKLEHEDDPIARKILGLGIVNRKLAKRPTMTFGYGSKQFGFKTQLKDYLQGLDNWPEIRDTLVDDEGKNMVGVACALLARLLWEALEVTVVKTVEGMKWLQHCADTIAVESQSVKWTVPFTGLPVKQGYMSFKKHRVRTVLMGNVVKSTIALPLTKVDSIKESNAISPNVVHSLDAAALVLAVNKAVDAGVASFSMVHDSYGTLPEDCSVMARVTREAFAQLYQHDVVADLADQFQAQTPEPLDPPPARGSLDLQGVLTSQYFFA